MQDYQQFVRNPSPYVVSNIPRVHQSFVNERYKNYLFRSDLADLIMNQLRRKVRTIECSMRASIEEFEGILAICHGRHVHLKDECTRVSYCLEGEEIRKSIVYGSRIEVIFSNVMHLFELLGNKFWCFPISDMHIQVRENLSDSFFTALSPINTNLKFSYDLYGGNMFITAPTCVMR